MGKNKIQTFKKLKPSATLDNIIQSSAVARPPNFFTLLVSGSR